MSLCRFCEHAGIDVKNASIIVITAITVPCNHNRRPRNQGSLAYMEMIGILPWYNTMKCQLQLMSGTLLGIYMLQNVSYSPKKISRVIPTTKLMSANKCP